MSARIVQVVLSIDRVADSFDQIAECCAVRRVTAVTDMQGPRRVCRYEFEQIAGFFLRFLPAVVVAVVENTGYFLMKRRTGNVKIDKAGAGNFDFVNELAWRQMFDDLRGKLSGILADGFSKAHRDIRCEVTVTGVARTFYGLTDRRQFRCVCELRHKRKGLLDKMCNIDLQWCAWEPRE